MGSNTKISAKTVLNSLGSFSDKATFLQRLNLAVKALLTTDLMAHCQVANVRDNVLILHLDTAAWATALHYQITDLLAQLRQQPPYAAIKSIQYKIRPLDGQRKVARIEWAKPLSTNTRKLLSDTAKSVSNKELAEALKRLSKN
ncbi:MAG: DUF721 domain-containing protein [Gammaproteobacteria bacterium]|nr:DUF721 domain-containing protein [Gammaproteobacteria bacterium]